jgi:hypothetical protein
MPWGCKCEGGSTLEIEVLRGLLLCYRNSERAIPMIRIQAWFPDGKKIYNSDIDGFNQAIQGKNTVTLVWPDGHYKTLRCPNMIVDADSPTY